MIRLAHSALAVDLLDPVADRARLGPRFCWGGYIWQVHDLATGALLSGPEWPSPTPSPHNGQGLPESFRHSTTTGEPLLWDGPLGLAPGAGALARDAQGLVHVTTPCIWQVATQATQVTFHTEQRVGAWHYRLERRIELQDRRLLSHSTLTNLGGTPLVFEWFAHPFFALESDGRLRAQLPPAVTLPENPGFSLAQGALAFRRAFVGADDGHLVLLHLPAAQPFSATLAHPQLEAVRFATDFAPFKCVLWANGHTLSLEPFLALDLAPGAPRAWTRTYDFEPRHA